jgi:hypothetical protein
MRVLPIIAAVVLAAGPARAGLRSPQVSVSGTALQSFLNAQGQAIDVATQQLDIFSTSIVVGWGFSVARLAGSGPAYFGLYDAAVASPPLLGVLPGSAAPGWLAVFSIRSSPTRLVVNLFDPNSVLAGTTTYLSGVNPDNTGYYCAGPTDIAYSQDARNTGGQPRILVFAGTGAHAGKNWIAVETAPGPGADYADAIYLLAVTATVDVTHTTWGALKQRFR